MLLCYKQPCHDIFSAELSSRYYMRINMYATLQCDIQEVDKDMLRQSITFLSQ